MQHCLQVKVGSLLNFTSFASRNITRPRVIAIAIAVSLFTVHLIIRSNFRTQINLFRLLYYIFEKIVSVDTGNVLMKPPVDHIVVDFSFLMRIVEFLAELAPAAHW